MGEKNSTGDLSGRERGVLPGEGKIAPVVTTAGHRASGLLDLESWNGGSAEDASYRLRAVTALTRSDHCEQ